MDSITTLSQQRDKCVLGTLNAIPFDKKKYIYSKVKSSVGTSEIWSLKFQFKMAAKKLIRKIPINLS